MAKPLNFKTMRRNYWTVTLDDENGTTVMLTTPTKAVFDKIVSIKDNLSDNEDEVNADALDDLYDICTAILNTNKGGIKFTNDEVSEMFRYEDIIALVHGYTLFINEVASQKN